MVDARDVLNDLNARLRAAFPGEVADVVLFGSQAKGTATEDSDIDLLLVWEGEPVHWKKKWAINEVCYETDLKFGITTHTMLISEAELQGLRGSQSIFQDAIKYGARAA